MGLQFLRLYMLKTFCKSDMTFLSLLVYYVRKAGAFSLICKKEV